MYEKKRLDGRISLKLELSKLYIKELNEKIKIATKLITSKEAQKVKLQAALLNMKGNESNFPKKGEAISKFKKIHSPKEKKTLFHESKAREIRKRF